jgi:UDP-glucose 4-epimerase
MSAMMANKKLTVSDGLRIACNVGLGHFRAPVSIQGIRKTRTFLSFNSVFAARVSKWRAGSNSFPASVRNCTICRGAFRQSPGFLAGCFLSFQPCLIVIDFKGNETVQERTVFFVKILVTGGAGYIGGTVAGLLAKKGHQVLIFDNLSHGRRDLLPPGVDFVQGELSDRLALENLFIAAHDAGNPFDGVLHFAALIEAGESMVRPETFFRNNTASTLSLFEAMIAHGLRRLVFSSTAAVYGEPEVVPIKEDARLLPTNPYGESKLLVEQMLAWLNRIHGLRYASLRYFNVAGAPEGPGGEITRGEAHEPETHLIPLVLDVALGRRASIKIFGDDYPTPDGTCVRDYIHVSDLADAHLLALAALEKNPA